MASLRHETAVADSKLVDELDKVSKQDKKLIKCSNYQTPAIPEMIVQSWKMNEFKYNVVPSPFPSLARGLFTTKVGEPGKDELAHRIVARGYDKFFNIGEVPWTTVSACMYVCMNVSNYPSSGLPLRSILHRLTV